jgi:hypothetical protein
LSEPVPIGRVRGVLQALVGLQQHEAPHRLVDLRVLRVVLLDDVTPEVVRNARAIAHAEP